MNTLDKLVKKIVVILPDIMDIQFGCEIKHREFTMLVSRFYKEMYGNYSMNLVGKDNEFSIQRKSDDTDIKILGRPITLEDVLRAVKEGQFAVSQSGMMFNYMTKEAYGHWEHGKPLSEQSPDTWDFLDKLIK